MNPIVSGALVMACVIVGLQFLRYWRSGRDVLFLCFALSFWLQGAQWLHAALVATPSEYSPGYYLLRLLAYALIVGGIAFKNLRPRSAQ